ncbi:hypothetical protein B0J13DRAFT_513510 [Dactylonectria estremocensis]|uniref:Uncharacterized protein n=1 Tax=Dactylonectria estremocensis TaxID=1079267 RepID=A0A9P9DIG2_9HYPO|nr:hypothetical protein B0J13DRAFT_513510 [Dactylonectria estremocensis]
MDAWKARKADLSSRHVQRCVRQLLKNKALWEAFNLVLDIPGLQHGMRTSTLHKLISLKCDEQVIKYLGHIRTVWSRFVQDNDEAIKKFDATDVKELELRCPRYSADDKAKIQSELDGGRIFRNFSQDERQAIWAVVTSTDCIIPSLYTLFEDVKLLQACVESMKHIISPVKETFNMALRASLTQGRMESEISADEEARIALLIRDLWMIAMQNFRLLSQQLRGSPERLLAKVPPQRANEPKLARFARFADQSGFHSPEISILRELPSGQEEELADNLTATVVSDSVNATLRRCGLPTYATYEHDRWLLTAGFLHCDYSELNGRGRDVTSFFVLQSIYFAFFGRPPLITNQDSFPMHEQITRDLRQDSQSEPRSSNYTNRIELGTEIADDQGSTNEATPERDPNINANSPWNPARYSPNNYKAFWSITLPSLMLMLLLFPFLGSIA